MKITDLMFDLDGVLVDQFRQLAYLEDISLAVLFARQKDWAINGGGRNYVMHLIEKYLHSHRCFAHCPPTPEFFELSQIAVAAANAGIKVSVLSSITTVTDWHAEITHQKNEWLDFTGFPCEEVHYVHGSEEKQHMAAPGIVLFDDYGVNIEQWAAKGGIGIKHDTEKPRPSIIKLREILNIPR